MGNTTPNQRAERDPPFPEAQQSPDCNYLVSVRSVEGDKIDLCLHPTQPSGSSRR